MTKKSKLNNNYYKGIVLLIVVIVGYVFIEYFSVNAYNYESAVKKVEEFSKEILVQYKIDSISSFLHPEYFGEKENLELQIHQLHPYGSPDSIKVVGYQITLGEEGIITVYLEGKAKKQTFYYTIALKRNNNFEYRIVNIVRNLAAIEVTGNGPYEGPSAYDGKVISVERYPKDEGTIRRESALATPSYDERIQRNEQISEKIVIDNIHQKYLYEEQKWVIVVDCVSDQSDFNETQAIQEEIETLWKNTLEAKANSTKVPYVHFRAFLKMANHLIDKEKFYGRLYQYDKTNNVWVSK